MKVTLRCMGIAGGIPCPKNIMGKYLRTCDFEAHGGRGECTFTSDLEYAMTFPDKSSALCYWRTCSKTVPVRPDGKPNRPLTAYHMLIEGDAEAIQ